MSTKSVCRTRLPKVPGYWLHKPTGQARTRIQGRDIYLGIYDSSESRKRYGDLVAKVLSGQPLEHVAVDHRGGMPPATISVNELSVAFLRFARQHYRKPDGRLTDEYHCFTSAISPLTKLYGLCPVDEFGPLALKIVRETMVAQGWCRGYINKSVGRIRRVFRFGVENELVDPTTLQRLEAVSPLLAGRTKAPDHPERHAVSQSDIDAVRKLVKPLVRDLIDLQLVTGARSGELLMLTTGLIERTGIIWTVDLREHKTSHRGKSRRLYFGPQAQLILRRYLNADLDHQLFSIRGDSYCRAVSNACKKAGVFRWTPHWLRHTAAARLREMFGLETAQAVLGHAKADMTEHYAGLTHARALEAAAQAG